MKIIYISISSRNAIFLLFRRSYHRFLFHIRFIYGFNFVVLHNIVIPLQFSILRDYFNNVLGTIECTCYIIPLKTTAGIRNIKYLGEKYASKIILMFRLIMGVLNDIINHFFFFFCSLYIIKTLN